MIELKPVDINKYSPFSSPAISLFVVVLFVMFILCPSLLCVGDYFDFNDSFLSSFLCVAMILMFVAFTRGWWLNKFLSVPEWRVMTQSENWVMGQAIQLQWDTIEPKKQIQSLQFDLKKYEAAEDTSSSTTTYRNIAKIAEIVTDIQGDEIRTGTCSFTVPVAPPTFSSQHNNVEWTIMMTCQLKWGLTTSCEYEVTLLPPLIDQTIRPPNADKVLANEGGLMISLANDSVHCLPGEELRGQVSWPSEREDDEVELRLLWYTEGRGDKDTTVVERLTFNLSAGQGRFELRLPTDEPCSFSAEYISVVWALELAVIPSEAAQKQRGVFQRKLKTKRTQLKLIVSPTRQPLVQQPEADNVG